MASSQSTSAAQSEAYEIEDEFDEDDDNAVNELYNTLDLPNRQVKRSALLLRLPKKKKRAKTGFVWKYTVKPLPGDDGLYNEAGAAIWRCNQCTGPPKELKVGGGTNRAAEHLESEHQLVQVDTRKVKRQRRQESDIAIAMQRASQVNQDRLSRKHSTGLDTHTLEQLYLRWIVVNNISFAHVNAPEFRAFLQYVSPAANDLLPTSSSTIRTWLERAYRQEKEHIKSALHSAISSIHLTFDLWSSSNNLSLFGVVAHFTDKTTHYRQLVLAIQEVDGAHSGENLAWSLMEILNDYKVKPQLGYLMSDTIQTQVMSHH
jgi:hypothetical protein